VPLVLTGLVLAACGQSVAGPGAGPPPATSVTEASPPLAAVAAAPTPTARPASTILQVAVVASDTSGGALHYRWRSTDGTVADVDAPSTTWAMVPGPGLHFIYVLVSNGMGGYTERRLAVNTDTLPGGRQPYARPLPYVAPPAGPRQGDVYRSFVAWGSGASHDVLIPDATVYVQDDVTLAQYPATAPTDLRGEYVVPNLPAGSNYSTWCTVPGTATPTFCSAGFSSGSMVMPSFATTDYLASYVGFFGPGTLSGNLTLQDGTPCGTVNEFFDVHTTATATLLGGGGQPMAGPVRTNEQGGFTLPWDYTNPPATLSIQCEGGPTLDLPLTIDQLNLGDVGALQIPGVGAPAVTSLTATLNGVVFASALFGGPAVVPPAPLPSDLYPRADQFLAEKGLDTRAGACAYYRAIGAAQGCDAAGNLVGAIRFDDWKRAVHIAPYALHDVPTFTASYINKVDLNLARVHQSISYGPNQTAAVVCNHLGPKDFFNPTQAAVDAAVDDANQNKNLVACVAMDYQVSPGVNGDAPFTRFLIFGPNGQLLPSINLDGRREKFVPGTCVVCHGGEHYAGKYPADGSGLADVGGHFLPYDVGNFEFSSKPGLTRVAQEQSIYRLNQNLLNAGPTPAASALIAGWYAGQPRRKTLNQDYIDPSWSAASAAGVQFYKDVYARSCRTCHVALVEGYNFDHYQNVTPGGPFYRAASPETDVGVTVCGDLFQTHRSHSMANSLVTFNRFWLSGDPAVNTIGLPSQPDLLSQFLLTPQGHPPCLPGQP
jgi:mono/diheme cytochrome c family protein